MAGYETTPEGYAACDADKRKAGDVPYEVVMLKRYKSRDYVPETIDNPVTGLCISRICIVEFEDGQLNLACRRTADGTTAWVDVNNINQGWAIDPVTWYELPTPAKTVESNPVSEEGEQPRTEESEQ